MSDLLAFEADRRAVNITINRYFIAVNITINRYFIVLAVQLLINLPHGQFSSSGSFYGTKVEF